MPQVVAVVKAGWAAWTAWAAKHVVAAFIIKTAVTVALSYAIGRMFSPKLSNGLNSASPLQMSRDPIASRRVIYGETRISGPILFWHETGTKREFAHVVVALAGHEVESIDDVYFNDQVVALDGAGGAIGTYAGLARVKKLLGSPDQTADSDLVAECGGLITSAHRLRNITCLYGRFRYDESKWSSGLPNLSARAKGRKVYDPRTDTTAWSNNPALCVRDYLTNTTFGLGVDVSEIDDASFIAAANVCDEEVGLAGGGTEKRYTCNGSFEVSAEPAVVLERLCSSFAGLVVYVGGKWICHAGAHRTPVVTLDENDLRAPISVQTKASLRDTCNRVKGTFSSPAEKWQMTDVTPVTDGSALSEDGGVEIWRDMELSFTTSHPTAQRLFKAELRRSRHDKVVKWPGKLTCLRVKAGDIVMVNNARWGFVAKPFLVAGLKFSTYDASGELAIGVDLDLVETSASVWDWVSGEEAIYVPGAATATGDPLNVPTPTGLALTTNNNNQKDGTIMPRLKIAWTAPTDEFVLSGGYVHIEYKRPADTSWTVWTSTLRGTATFDFITDVVANLEYQVRVRFENVYRIKGAYAQTSATVGLDTTVPAEPTGLVATASPGGVTLDWDDNTEDDLDEYALLRSTSPSFTSPVVIWRGRASAFTDFLVAQGTTYYYKVVAVDATGNESPVSAVASAEPNPATGNFTDYIFTRAATAPGTPSGATPAGWYDAPPVGTLPLWVAVAEKTSTGALVGGWSTPVRLTGDSGVDGEDGADGKMVEFVWKRAASQPAAPSGNGIPAGWHDDPPAGSDPLWMSKAKQEIDGTLVAGEIWSTPIRHDGPAGANGAPGTPGTNGIDGLDGEDGKLVEFVWKRAASQPAAPTGNGIPAGWSDDPPAGSDPLWMSKVKQELNGVLVAGESWSTPIRHDGPAGSNGAPGEDGASIQVEYSVDGSSSWHSTFTTGDLYMRQRVGSGAWSAAIRIVGEQGPAGPAGGTNKVATPAISFSPASGTSPSDTSNCTITCATSGATIYYQYNGIIHIYSGTFGVMKLREVSAWAEKSDMVQSDTAWDMYEDNT